MLAASRFVRREGGGTSPRSQDASTARIIRRTAAACAAPRCRTPRRSSRERHRLSPDRTPTPAARRRDRRGPRRDACAARRRRLAATVHRSSGTKADVRELALLDGDEVADALAGLVVRSAMVVCRHQHGVLECLRGPAASPPRDRRPRRETTQRPVAADCPLPDMRPMPPPTTVPRSAASVIHGRRVYVRDAAVLDANLRRRFRRGQHRRRRQVTSEESPTQLAPPLELITNPLVHWAGDRPAARSACSRPPHAAARLDHAVLLQRVHDQPDELVHQLRH